MAVTDQDLELMEQWLDGELPEGQTEALRARISGEPELAAVLDRLRGDRKMRASIFSALEPANHDVDALINNVRRAVRKEEVWTSRMRILRNVTGIAASLAMVFFAGWISRSKLHVGPLPQSINLPSNAILVQVPDPRPIPIPTTVPTPGPTLASGGTPSITGVPVDSNGISRLRPTYKVLLVDPFSNVIGGYQFERPEDAVKFQEEFVSLQRKRAPGVNPIAPQPNLVNENK